MIFPPLVGFKQYEQTSADIQSRIVGTTTFTGVQIESFATHFIDRVIGQTSTPHPGMRRGVSIEDVLDALLHPDKIGGKFVILMMGIFDKPCMGKMLLSL